MKAKGAEEYSSTKTLYEAKIPCDVKEKEIKEIKYSLYLSTIFKNFNRENNIHKHWKYYGIYGNNNELLNFNYNKNIYFDFPIVIKIPDIIDINDKLVNTNKEFSDYLTLSGKINQYLKTSVIYKPYFYN